jgi:hypothetical protein
VIHLWDQLRHYGTHHGVDPVIFAALYLARLPLLIAALSALTRRIRRHEPILATAAVFLALGLFPYTYILAFGHDLSPWFIVAVVVVIALVSAQALRKVRTTLRAEATAVPTQ